MYLCFISTSSYTILNANLQSICNTSTNELYLSLYDKLVGIIRSTSEIFKKKYISFQIGSKCRLLSVS